MAAASSSVSPWSAPPARFQRAIVVWDAIAVAAHVWTYNPRYVSGWELPGQLPIEELLFFVVIPLCGLLTYNAVNAILERVRRLRNQTASKS